LGEGDPVLERSRLFARDPENELQPPPPPPHPRPDDAPIGTEQPIPEIVDYRKIAIDIPVVEKMELLLTAMSISDEPTDRALAVSIIEDDLG
jgi:hypothetical protein